MTCLQGVMRFHGGKFGLGYGIRVPVDPDKLERLTAYAVQVR